MIESTVVLDEADLNSLTATGSLWFALGDQKFELHTKPQPTYSDTAIRVRPEHLDALRTVGEIGFRRPWGRLTVAMATEATR